MTERSSSVHMSHLEENLDFSFFDSENRSKSNDGWMMVEIR